MGMLHLIQNLSRLYGKVEVNIWLLNQVVHQRPSPTTCCNHNSLLTVQCILGSLNSSNLAAISMSEFIKFIISDHTDQKEFKHQ